VIVGSRTPPFLTTVQSVFFGSQRNFLTICLWPDLAIASTLPYIYCLLRDYPSSPSTVQDLPFPLCVTVVTLGFPLVLSAPFLGVFRVPPTFFEGACPRFPKTILDMMATFFIGLFLFFPVSSWPGFFKLKSGGKSFAGECVAPSTGLVPPSRPPVVTRIQVS